MADVKYSVKLYCDSGMVMLSRAVAFSFTKERYTPFTYFAGVFIGNVNPYEVRQVDFLLNERRVHSGTADSISCEERNGQRLIRIRSYGFSMMLGQNQAEPGIITSPDLTAVMTRGHGIYGVEHQQDTARVNYVYINEKDSIWDAVCVYSMKAYGTLPYIKGENEVWCQRGERTYFNYNSDKIISAESGVRLSGMISAAHTQDAEGNWTYSRENEFASYRHITNEKYMARDKEWLYNLNRQLDYRIFSSEKGRVYKSFTYAGYRNEDLLDRVTMMKGDIQLINDEADRIRVTGSRKGIFTAISTYSDPLCPMP